MNRDEETFAWIQLPQGRIRFGGAIRGGDEGRHETYSVDIDGIITYGEIENIFSTNGNDYNVEVISFGYGMIENVGNPHANARGTYTETQLKLVQSLVVQLIQAGLHFEERPSVLRESLESHFLGRVLFREGWAYVRQDNTP